MDGKTLECWELKGAQKLLFEGGEGDFPVTMWVSEHLPGGIVRSVTHPPTGPEGVIQVTAFGGKKK